MGIIRSDYQLYGAKTKKLLCVSYSFFEMLLCMPKEDRTRDWSKEPPTTDGEVLRMHRETLRQRTGLKQTGRATAEMLGLKEDNYRAIEYDTRSLKPEEAKILQSAWGIPWRQFYLVGFRSLSRSTQEENPLTKELAPPAIVRQIESSTAREPRSGYPSSPSSPRLALPISEVEVPLVGSVRATGWDSPMESNARESIPADQYAEDVFVSYVVGHSMEAFLKEDDQAVWKLAQGRELINDVVYAVNQNGEVTVKQYKHGPRGYYLHALNPEYDDLYGVEDVDEDPEWRIHGILVAINRIQDGDTVRRHNPKRLRPK